MSRRINQAIAAELLVEENRVDAAVELLDSGATVPFIARYRKEVTGALDDTQLRYLEERLGYLRELEERRETVLKSISEQGRLTDDLERSVRAAATKAELEDLYLPFKPKRRTRAAIAREAGLEPLAVALLEEPALDPQVTARTFVDPDRGVEDTEAALEGARQILMERFAEDAGLLGELRDLLWDNAQLRAGVVDGKQAEGAKFADYFDYAEPLSRIPSHRALALFRGRGEGVLTLELDPGGDDGHADCSARVARRFGISDQGRPADGWLLDAARWGWKVKLFTHLDLELKMRLREAAEEEAIRVFGANLKDLLLAAPAGQRAILGLDPGLRTGVKVAVVDATGKVLVTDTVYPHPPRNRKDEAIACLARLAAEHGVELVAIGNGTASRETDALVRELMRRHPELGLGRLIVSEAGASVYSASALASEELPGMDVSLRGAVSIARRVQDPLAELVKIEPKAIGVGQYQHDVNQSRLARKLDATVEDCVNAVGVNINTASAALLGCVAGLNRTRADNIVAFRDAHGQFRSRREIREVTGIGDKTFEQSAGFLRIVGGDDPLDASAVHPEAYPVVARILERQRKPLTEIMGNRALLGKLNPAEFADDRFGIHTVTDIIAELEKPGRDPRGEFQTAAFAEGVDTIGDLRPGMVLEGTVTNVANFGAFVDIGVHQDGLVHISAMARKFVKDPREVVKTGETVKVRVLDVDLERKRISLSLRLDDDAGADTGRRPDTHTPQKTKKTASRREKPAVRPASGAMAQALAAAMKKG